MKITLTKSEFLSIFNASEQLNTLLERGAEGQAERDLNRDIRNLNRVLAKAKKAKANATISQPGPVPPQS